MRKGNFFITFGLLLLAAALCLSAYNIWEDRTAAKASLSAVSQLQEQILEYRQELVDSGSVLPEPTIPMYSENSPTPIPEMPVMEIDGVEYLGIIEIPAQELNLPVKMEWDFDSLKYSPCRYTGSYYSRDMIVAGHSYTGHFRPLRWIEVGTDVYLINAEGTVFHYVVSEVEILWSNEGERLREGDWDLTLFTCTPSGQSRSTVRCTLVED